MGAGIRKTCGKCFSIDYDSKLQYCKKCGWSPIKDQAKLHHIIDLELGDETIEDEKCCNNSNIE